MLLGQTLCECSPFVHTMSKGTKKPAGSWKPGESKLSLRAAPCCRAQGCRCWAVAACWHRWACSAPSPPRPPALPLSWHGRHTAAPGTAPGGSWPRKALTAVTLSSPACVLCGRVDEDSSILGHKKELGGFYFHEFCAVSSLMAPASFLQPVISIFLP